MSGLAGKQQSALYSFVATLTRLLQKEVGFAEID